ncbi:hypothetical protein BDV32DRAFT_116220 [Aspergillus pseudonomiae]|nr:hypothetical protein BDV32DRAFT_116220 [Aspergillus pseudonomiae]
MNHGGMDDRVSTRIYRELILRPPRYTSHVYVNEGAFDAIPLQGMIPTRDQGHPMESPGTKQVDGYTEGFVFTWSLPRVGTYIHTYLTTNCTSCEVMCGASKPEWHALALDN